MKKEIPIGAGKTSIELDEIPGVPGQKKKFKISLMNHGGYYHDAEMTLAGLEDLGGEIQKYFQEFMTREEV